MKSAVTSNVPGASAHVVRDLDGRRFIVTGPYSGIGRVTAANLASRGAAVVLAGRSFERCQALAAELRRPSDADRIEVLALDLSDLASVRAAAEQLIARGGRDRKSTRLNSSHANTSYAVFCLKKKNG